MKDARVLLAALAACAVLGAAQSQSLHSPLHRTVPPVLPETAMFHVRPQSLSRPYLIDSALVKSTTDTSQRVLTYRTDGLLSLDLTQVQSNGEWNNSLRAGFTYDAQNNLITELDETWNGSQWDSNGRNTYTYDSGGRLLTELVEAWQANQWTPQMLTTWTYDTYGNMLRWLSQQWAGGQFVNSERVTDTYDSSGLRQTYLLEDWVNAQWQGTFRETYTYDPYRRLSTTFGEEWTAGEWLNSYFTSNVYTANGLIQNSLTQLWDGSWEDASRSTYSYDPAGNLLTKLDEFFVFGDWIKSARLTYTYPQSGPWVTGYSERWQNEQWVPSDRAFSVLDSVGNRTNYYGYAVALAYSTLPTSVAGNPHAEPGGFALTRIYPNPFNPATTIAFQIAKRGFVRLDILDLLGRDVAALVSAMKQAGTYAVTWYASGVASGTYFCRLHVSPDTDSGPGDFIQTKKIVLLK